VGAHLEGRAGFGARLLAGQKPFNTCVEFVSDSQQGLNARGLDLSLSLSGLGRRIPRKNLSNANALGKFTL
jgi:hypothetical protein